MTNQVHAQYALNLDQCVNLISTIGKQRTVLAQGDMGQGKSSMLTMLAEKHPDYVPVYFDATTKDLGELMIPSLQSVEPMVVCVWFQTKSWACITTSLSFL